MLLLLANAGFVMTADDTIIATAAIARIAKVVVFVIFVVALFYFTPLGNDKSLLINLFLNFVNSSSYRF